MIRGKLCHTCDWWVANISDFCRVSQLEYERLGERILAYKCMWAF